MNTCRTCKHWGPYLESDRESGTYTGTCKKIREKIDIIIDQGRGWGAGGASVDYVETEPDFGCALHEEVAK